MKREFTFNDGKSNKFWNIEIQGDSFAVTYGKVGTTGQTQTKSFDDDKVAEDAANKLVAEKVKKGYIESSAQKGAPSPSTTPQPSPKAKATPLKAKGSRKSSSEKEEDTPAPPGESEKSDETTLDWKTGAERVLKLEPRDWLWATWRSRVPESRGGEGKPFDKEEALERLAKLPGKSYWQVTWEKAQLASSLSREEAHFWLTVMTTGQKYASSGYAALFRNEFIPKIDKLGYDGQVSSDAVVRDLTRGAGGYRLINPLLIHVLSFLFSPLEVLDMVLKTHSALMDKGKRRYADLGLIETFCKGFRQYLLPYLSTADAESMKERLRMELRSQKWPDDFYEPPHIAFHLAAQVGLHTELLSVVQGLKDDIYKTGENWHDHYHRPQEVIFGLGNAEEVASQMLRLKLPLRSPQHIRAWLATTEFSALDHVKDSILGSIGRDYTTSAKEVAEENTKTFALAEAPEVAPQMLQLALESRAPRPARAWINEHPLHSVRGLVAVAAGRGKLAEAAIEQLRLFKKRGGDEALREAAQTLSESDYSRVQSAVIDWEEKFYEPFTDDNTPEPLRAAMKDANLKASKTSWVYASDLPPVTYGSHRLSDAQVELLLTALRSPGHPLTRAIKESADRASLDAFAWKLFERWMGESAPSKEKWAMLAIGELGGDGCALKLTPLIRAWPGESQHQRAVTGIECLRAIGSDTALMQINGIAQKVKFKGLQGKATEAMEGIAKDRGLSRAQLEDRVVPMLDLDARGTRIFDFGPRQFRFVLSPEMKPLVREEGGATLAKPRPDLPKPSSKDDATKAESAVAEWKLLKKQIAELVKVQAVRLENAMVRGRRWTPEEFETLLARHPLMQNLVRLLVWEAASGNRRATFRAVEDGSYADQNDEEFDLAAGEWAHIGIAHPLHLSAAEKSAWGEIFSDYEIVPPFPQLGRAVYSLEGEEGSVKEITRFKNIEMQPQTLCFGLEKLGWERGPALDAGGFYEHYKYFESSDATACVVYEPGLFMGGQEYWEPQKITEAYFVDNKRSKHEMGYWGYPDKKKAVNLSEVDAVALSEVLKDLSELTAKGTEK